MSNELAQMAPMPVHRNTDDPLWRKLWNAYEPVITALRRIPLVTDVEISGGMFGITAQLTDGSHLWISSVGELPLDPKEVEGWHVRRGHEDTPTVDELVYNSTEDGEHAQHSNNVVPLLRAISAFVTERRLAPRRIDLVAVQIDGVTRKHKRISQVVQGPFDDRHAAVKEYGYTTHGLIQDGWRCIHEQGGVDWPLTVWELNGEIATVYLAHVGQASA
ncbi:MULTISPECIES: hypothetical protein [unclassified Streptomyces]|uniref:hypothetical protein n=1 Tax=unclassified Streptomyces TaxID=2593676 RepID=UPI002E135D34|nr:hypothetical protein OG452_24895 [Streptomyces sp. NBC_01197]WSS49009.1 hypothetical protein OG708_10350 [Streptomyces sp. NBC_01180]